MSHHRNTREVKRQTGTNHSKLFISAAVLLLVVWLAACSPTLEARHKTEPAGNPSPQATPAATQTASPSKMATPTPPYNEIQPTRSPSRLPPRLEPIPSLGTTPVVGEVPSQLMDQILADLEKRLGIDRQAIQVIRAESMVWSDGSLGCPVPGQFYTQALVNGYWVVLRAGSNDYDYRASQSGYFTLCERMIK